MKSWREARGLSQRRLAILLDVDQVTVGRWERGERRPPGRMLELALQQLDQQLAADKDQT